MDDKATNVRFKVFVLIVIWFMIIGGIALGWRYLVRPKQEAEEHKKTEAKRHEIIEKTSAPSRYKYTVNMAADTFSGYAIMRNASFRDENTKFGIRIELTDDQADYPQRLMNLAEGKLDMAAFTIDALFKSATDAVAAKKIELDNIPTIVAIIDETKGADAMVASKLKFPNLDSLNIPDLKIVCVKDSPSETLARVVMAHFNLDRLPDNPFDFKANIDDVYKEYQRTKPTESKVFVMWEPMVSKVIENPDYHNLVNSSKFRGYIVDVIVARRGFLLQNKELVVDVVKSYLKSMYDARMSMPQLIFDDARMCGTTLRIEQAKALVDQIWWKNTQENFSHFGLTTSKGVQHLQEINSNIMDVLLKTKAIKEDISIGQPNFWYSELVMRQLFDSSWHPGFGEEAVRQEKSLVVLNEDQWKQLNPVGTLQVPRLVFARGGTRLNESSFSTLDKLVESLKTWPQYYLMVEGHHANGGDDQANRELAEARAKAAVEYLISKGVDRSRIHADTSKTNGSTTVAFVLGELPY